MNIETPLHILVGDCRTTLKKLRAASVQTCVTSPPYYGLRDYGTAKWEGGDSACDHQYQKGGRNPETSAKQTSNNGTQYSQYEKVCKKCGARRVDQQIGLEETPEAYIQNLLLVFGEVWRVLKPDGTLWVNLGDSYAGSGGAGEWSKRKAGKQEYLQPAGDNPNRFAKNFGLKPKDLIGIPWAFAFAMRAAGWYLRRDIIWFKPNPMPESVTDRPTSAHEYIFLFSKSAKYFYDYEAVLEPSTDSRVGSVVPAGNDKILNDVGEMNHNTRIGLTREREYKPNRNKRSVWTVEESNHKNILIEDSGRRPHSMHTARANGEGEPETQTKDGIPARNKRSVWTVSTKPYAGAHFATFPPDLIEPCILAGTSEKGECPECGKAWVRVTEKERTFESGSGKAGNMPKGKNGKDLQGGGETLDIRRGPVVHTETLGWTPGCSCNAGDPIPQTVLDPFGGSGTTAQVSIENNRHAILCELNQEYIPLIKERCGQLQRVLF